MTEKKPGSDFVVVWLCVSVHECACVSASQSESGKHHHSLLALTTCAHSTNSALKRSQTAENALIMKLRLKTNDMFRHCNSVLWFPLHTEVMCVLLYHFPQNYYLYQAMYFFIEIRKVFLCKSKKVWTSALLRLVHIASCTKHTQTTLFDYVPHVFLIGGDRQNSSKLKAGTTAWALWSFSVFTALLTASVEGVVIRLIGSPQEAFTHTSQLPLTQIS